MMEEHHLRRLQRDLTFQGEIVDLYTDTVELPDGRVEHWDFVDHKKGGGACIVPVLPDGRILMTRQYRPAIDEMVLELPAGGQDSPDEDTLLTARRELEEETGYTAERMIPLPRIQTAVAWTNEFTDIYLAENVKRKGSQHLDEAEEIRVKPYPLEELLSMIYHRQLQDAKSVAGILAYVVYRDHLEVAGRGGHNEKLGK